MGQHTLLSSILSLDGVFQSCIVLQVLFGYFLWTSAHRTLCLSPSSVCNVLQNGLLVIVVSALLVTHRLHHFLLSEGAFSLFFGGLESTTCYRRDYYYTQ